MVALCEPPMLPQPLADYATQAGCGDKLARPGTGRGLTTRQRTLAKVRCARKLRWESQR
jgi:hypothetical protein